MNRLALQRHILRGALRRWRSWFRKNGAYASLVFVLAVSLAEPLACFLHCRLWEWSHRSSHNHAHHQHAAHTAHEHSVAGAMTFSTQHGQLASSGANAQMASGPLCMMEVDHNTSTPQAPAPLSSLDHLAALLTLLLLISTAQLLAIVATPSRSPPERSNAPLVPPPILLEQW
jgi:hypothetical protein